MPAAPGLTVEARAATPPAALRAARAPDGAAASSARDATRRRARWRRSSAAARGRAPRVQPPAPAAVAPVPRSAGRPAAGSACRRVAPPATATARKRVPWSAETAVVTVGGRAVAGAAVAGPAGASLAATPCSLPPRMTTADGSAAAAGSGGANGRAPVRAGDIASEASRWDVAAGDPERDRRAARRPQLALAGIACAGRLRSLRRDRLHRLRRRERLQRGDAAPGQLAGLQRSQERSQGLDVDHRPVPGACAARIATVPASPGGDAGSPTTDTPPRARARSGRARGVRRAGAARAA